ncbi:MAG TPA: toll/interleukin-1 receptor domain-containing protein [Gemmataceae bacterium]|nr:toll/interleukin-1 receptor domain-containing protein [Gemmataceae bacterium]
MARKKEGAKAGARRGYRIFVSHATADKWIARVLCEKLEGVGAETFRDDRDIAGGDNIPERLRDEILSADEVLVLLTPNSITRPWVLLEIGCAWGHNRRIIPIRYNVEVEAIPALLQPTKVIDLNAVNDYLNEVAARVRGKRR